MMVTVTMRMKVVVIMMQRKMKRTMMLTMTPTMMKMKMMTMRKNQKLGPALATRILPREKIVSLRILLTWMSRNVRRSGSNS